MNSWNLVGADTHSKARAGLLHLPHGDVGDTHLYARWHSGYRKSCSPGRIG
jgi:hypothetical protein